MKLDGIGTLYPVLTSEGVADAKDFSTQDNVTRLGISFLADQSKKSQFKDSAMKQGTKLSTQLYSDLNESLTPSPSPTGEGSGNTGGSNSGGGNGGDELDEN